MEIRINSVHIGDAISRRILALGMSKSEFARRFGILQQHVNKILEKKSIDTDKLVKICQILEYDFFKLYSPSDISINAVGSAVTTGDGSATKYASEAALASRNEMLADKILILESTIEDKNKIIALLEKRER